MATIFESIKILVEAAWKWLISHTTGMSRSTLAWGGLALGGVILLSVNLLSWAALRGWNADMTEDHLFTISSGTKQILANVDEPITVRLYFSKKLGEMGPQYSRYFDRVRTMLEQYRDLSGGKLELSILDPEPFSDAEDRAVAAGLRGLRLNAEGEVGYFGLTATNSTDIEERISFFSPESEGVLEYDLTKLIYTLNNPKKRVVGLLTSLPIDGGEIPANMAAGQTAQPIPPWLIMEQIREFFDVVKVEPTASEIPANIDILIVAQPTEMNPMAAYAVDQFALKGGKVLAFVDPAAESSQMTLMSKTGNGRSEFSKLLKSWGVEIDYTKVAADIKSARRVQFGGRDAQGMVTEFVAWLTLGKSSMDQNDVLSNGIEVLQLASPGHFKKVEGTAMTVTPIIKTSNEAMEIDAKKVGLGGDPRALLRDYKPGGQVLNLAARLSGEAKSAYPDGRPFAEDRDSNQAKDTPDEKSTPPAESEADKASRLKGHIASGRVNVIAIADTDLLADRFWAEKREVMGQKVVVPNSNNASFVLGALENLSGSDALIALRGRGVRERPFTLVEGIRRDAEIKFREKEDGLTKKLENLKAEMAKLEQTGQEGTVVVTEKERQSIEKSKIEMLETRRELRNVKLALRHDIDYLDAWLKFANIAMVPLLLGFGGLGWSLWQSRRQKTNS